SESALPNLGFWSEGAMAPNIVDYAVDKAGNIYAADQLNGDGEYGFGGLIRFTPDGAMTEYPTYVAGQGPTSVAFDRRDGKLYLGSNYFVQNKINEGSIVQVDPKFW
ncbi:MAG TPA: hypothetical protein VK760_07860, partial [Candidatus Acidoferrales bacterium]|nr:hypothetical protein [Candidatus Acidoferrales bacterium]